MKKTNNKIVIYLFSFFFGITMFTTGLTGFVGENILATFSAVILGNSVEQFPKVFGLMMFMMGVAGYAQATIKDKYLVTYFIAVELTLATTVGYGPTLLYYIFGTMPDHYMMVHYLVVGLAGFCIGFEIPIVMRIVAQIGVDLKDNFRVVYSMDYFGAFLGGFLFFDFFIKYYPLTEMGFVLSCLNFTLATAAVIYLMTQGMVKRKFVVICVLATVCASQVYGYKHAIHWSNVLEQKFYGDPITYKETTKYQHLVLTESKVIEDTRLYINGNTQFSSTDEVRYHEMLVHLLFALKKDIKKVLVLGGGDGLALREILKYKNVEEVTLVDLDPGMVKFASTNEIMRKLNNDSFNDARVFTPKSKSVTGLGVEGIYIQNETIDKKVTNEWVADVDVFHVDADRFVSELHGKKWDAIIIDFPDPSSIELVKLYSKEFYKKLQWQMNEGALISIQSTSPYFAKEAYLTIGRTLESSGLKTLPYRQNIPSFGDWGYYLAWKGSETKEEINTKIKNVEGFQVDTKFITPEILTASLAFGKDELTTKEICVNSLMNPCLLDQYINKSWLLE